MGQNIKTCITCNHYQQRAYEGPACAIAWVVRPSIDPVTGRPLSGFNRDCSSERLIGSECGPKGKMWEAEDAREPGKLERGIIKVLDWIF